MNCSACHSAIPNDAVYCPHCGAAQQRASTGPTQRLGPPDLNQQPGATIGERTIRQGICPRCSAATIYTDANRGGIPSDQLEIIPSKHGYVTHYVCRSCGYLEAYVLDPDDRDAIEEHWRHVDPHSRPAAQHEQHVRQLLAQGLMMAAVDYVRAALGLDVEAAIRYVEALEGR